MEPASHYSLLVAVSVPYCPALPNPGLQMEARLKLGRWMQTHG